MKLLGFALLLPAAFALPGDTDLRFTRQTIPTSGHAPRALAVADINHDNNPDILVTNADSGTLTVLLGDGRGHFHPAPGSPFPAGPQPNDLALADMNGDGHLDAVIPNHQAPTITILLGDGKGSFTPTPGSPFDVHSFPHPHGIAVADFDGDNHLDVATDSWGHNQIELLTGDGHGGLRLPGHYFDTGHRPYERLRTADINRDGHPDIVTTNLDDNTVSILLGDGHGAFTNAPGSPVPAGAKPWQSFVGDINGDGAPDIIVIPYQRDIAGDSQNVVTVLLNNGRGAFSPAPGTPLPLGGCRGPNSVTAGKLTGREAIAISCAQSHTLMLYTRNGAGAYHAQSIAIPGGWGSVTLAPITRDGPAALITADADANTITILQAD